MTKSRPENNEWAPRRSFYPLFSFIFIKKWCDKNNKIDESKK
jgi:hypothetical protein